MAIPRKQQIDTENPGYQHLIAEFRTLMSPASTALNDNRIHTWPNRIIMLNYTNEHHELNQVY